MALDSSCKCCYLPNDDDHCSVVPLCMTFVKNWCIIFQKHCLFPISNPNIKTLRIVTAPLKKTKTLTWLFLLTKNTIKQKMFLQLYLSILITSSFATQLYNLVNSSLFFLFWNLASHQEFISLFFLYSSYTYSNKIFKIDLLYHWCCLNFSCRIGAKKTLNFCPFWTREKEKRS